MYDKVKMWKVGNYDNVIDRLDNPTMISSVETGEVYKCIGSINNLTVQVKNGSISIDGSLAKFLYGNNIETLDRDSTEEAINKLSKCLGINIDEADITELEFGTNFIMKQPIYNYINKLNELSGFYINKMNNESLYYNSIGRTKGSKGKNNKVLVFYDKSKESKNDLLNGINNQNLLRFEVRYNGRICRQLKQQEVKAKTLYDPIFYQIMLNDYIEHYRMIPKSKEAKFIIESIKSPKDVINCIVSKYITECSSIDEIMTKLYTMDMLKSPKHYYRTKKMLEKAQWANYEPKELPIIQELDSHINNLIKAM